MQTSRKTAFSEDDTVDVWSNDNCDTIVFRVRKQRYLSANTGHLLSYHRLPTHSYRSVSVLFAALCRIPGRRVIATPTDPTAILSPHSFGAGWGLRGGDGGIKERAKGTNTLRQRRRHPSSYRFLPERTRQLYTVGRRDNALSRRQLRTTFMLPRPWKCRRHERRADCRRRCYGYFCFRRRLHCCCCCCCWTSSALRPHPYAKRDCALANSTVAATVNAATTCTAFGTCGEWGEAIWNIYFQLQPVRYPVTSSPMPVYTFGSPLPAKGSLNLRKNPSGVCLLITAYSGGHFARLVRRPSRIARGTRFSL